MPPDLEPASALAAIDVTPVDHPKSPAEEFALKLLTESWIDETGQHDRRVMARLIQEAELAIRANEREPLEKELELMGGELDMAREEVKHCRERIASLEAQLASAPRWIPVEERLPFQGSPVLTLEAGGTMPMVCVYHDGTWYNIDNGSAYDVTHWMPLPELPPPAAQKEPHGR